MGMTDPAGEENDAIIESGASQAEAGIAATGVSSRLSESQRGISGAEPIPAGAFRVDQGQALVRLPTLAAEKAIDKFAATVEPAGGVPKPTGTLVLLGEVQSS